MNIFYKNLQNIRGKERDREKKEMQLDWFILYCVYGIKGIFAICIQRLKTQSALGGNLCNFQPDNKY